MTAIINARTYRHTKERGEVRRWWQETLEAEKGTGRARFGSSRNPIWRGGGVVWANENHMRLRRPANVSLLNKL